jgi:molecular chaperone DnaK
MNISAKDKGTNKEQSIKIESSSGLSEEEIARMKKEAQENADADNKRKEEVEALNQADGLIFQTEKQLKEYGDKIPADKKAPIETALQELKTAYESKSLEAIKPAMEKLNQVFQAASQEMYNNQSAQGDAGNAQNEAPKNGGEEVTDVDFEEVDDKK